VKRALRIVVSVWIVLNGLGVFGCGEGGGGIGMSVPASGARWGGGHPGPDIFVSGGPVYR
jgi:hypothetical protein